MNTSKILTIVLIEFFFLSSFGIHINATLPCNIVSFVATQLVGQPSSKYPNEVFINYVLYGHSDVHFTYNNFLTKFGTKTNNYFDGALVIANDSRIGGIYVGWYIVIPIPGSQISLVPLKYIPIYFPNGYTMLEVNRSIFSWGMGRENGTYKNSYISNNSPSQFGFGYHRGGFIDNLCWTKYVFPNVDKLFIQTYGYLKNYDPITGLGIVEIRVIELDYYKYLGLSLVNDHFENRMYIQNTFDNNILYHGSLWLTLNESSSYYNFSGVWNGGNNEIFNSI